MVWEQSPAKCVELLPVPFSGFSGQHGVGAVACALFRCQGRVAAVACALVSALAIVGAVACSHVKEGQAWGAVQGWV